MKDQCYKKLVNSSSVNFFIKFYFCKTKTRKIKKFKINFESVEINGLKYRRCMS